MSRFRAFAGWVTASTPVLRATRGWYDELIWKWEQRTSNTTSWSERASNTTTWTGRTSNTTTWTRRT